MAFLDNLAAPHRANQSPKFVLNRGSCIAGNCGGTIQKTPYDSRDWITSALASMNEIFTPAAASHATTATPARVEVSRIGAVAALTLNRPEALNAFDDGMRQIFSAEIPLIAALGECEGVFSWRRCARHCGYGHAGYDGRARLFQGRV